MGRQSLVLVVVGLVLAGCGGGRHEAAAQPPSAFVAQANAVCARSTTRTERLTRLRALRPPRGGENLYDHWLRAEADALAAARAIADRTKTPESDPLVRLTIAEGKITGYARRLGAEACARQGTGTMPP